MNNEFSVIIIVIVTIFFYLVFINWLELYERKNKMNEKQK